MMNFPHATLNKKRKLTEVEKHPHFVKLPKGSSSPTNSIYKQFDIVMQTKAVNTYANVASIVRCAEPFILRVKVGNKVKEIKSKVK